MTEMMMIVRMIFLMNSCFLPSHLSLLLLCLLRHLYHLYHRRKKESLTVTTLIKLFCAC